MRNTNLRQANMLRKAVQCLFFFLPFYILLLYILLYFSACTKHPFYSKHENENHFETCIMDAAALLALGHQAEEALLLPARPSHSVQPVWTAAREQAPSCHSTQTCQHTKCGSICITWRGKFWVWWIIDICSGARDLNMQKYSSSLTRLEGSTQVASGARESESLFLWNLTQLRDINEQTDPQPSANKFPGAARNRLTSQKTVFS